MKKQLVASVVGLFLMGMASGALATKVTYEYTIHGDQFMEYITKYGPDDSTAADQGLYDGARRFTPHASTDNYPNGYSSFHSSSNQAFKYWTDTGDRLVDINLWGYGGNGANWGESFKIEDWSSASASGLKNWEAYTYTWPWGTPPENNDGELLGWWASDETGQYYDYENGLAFDQFNDTQFTFSLTLDTDDPTFTGDSPWYNDTAGQLVFWFGAEAMNWQETLTGRYEGNIILQGTEVAPVPEPATILLFGFGLAGLVGVSRRKKK